MAANSSKESALDEKNSGLGLAALILIVLFAALGGFLLRIIKPLKLFERDWDGCF